MTNRQEVAKRKLIASREFLLQLKDVLRRSCNLPAQRSTDFLELRPLHRNGENSCELHVMDGLCIAAQFDELEEQVVVDVLWRPDQNEPFSGWSVTLDQEYYRHRALRVIAHEFLYGFMTYNNYGLPWTLETLGFKEEDSIVNHFPELEFITRPLMASWSNVRNERQVMPT